MPTIARPLGLLFACVASGCSSGTEPDTQQDARVAAAVSMVSAASASLSAAASLSLDRQSRVAEFVPFLTMAGAIGTSAADRFPLPPNLAPFVGRVYEWNPVTAAYEWNASRTQASTDPPSVGSMEFVLYRLDPATATPLVPLEEIGYLEAYSRSNRHLTTLVFLNPGVNGNPDTTILWGTEYTLKDGNFIGFRSGYDWYVEDRGTRRVEFWYGFSDPGRSGFIVSPMLGETAIGDSVTRQLEAANGLVVAGAEPAVLLGPGQPHVFFNFGWEPGTGKFCGGTMQGQEPDAVLVAASIPDGRPCGAENLEVALVGGDPIFNDAADVWPEEVAEMTAGLRAMVVALQQLSSLWVDLVGPAYLVGQVTGSY